MRSEIQNQQHEVAELRLLEKKRERERARGEVDEDIQCRTKMGEWVGQAGEVRREGLLLLTVEMGGGGWAVVMDTRTPTSVGKNISRMLFQSSPSERNELFLPGRMVS